MNMIASFPDPFRQFAMFVLNFTFCCVLWMSVVVLVVGGKVYMEEEYSKAGFDMNQVSDKI